MNGQDYEQLTLFQGDSPASHSLLPGSGEARKMTATSGQEMLRIIRELPAVLGCWRKCCWNHPNGTR